MIYIVHKYHQNEKYFSQIWDGHDDLCKGSPAQACAKECSRSRLKKLSQSEPSCY